VHIIIYNLIIYLMLIHTILTRSLVDYQMIKSDQLIRYLFSSINMVICIYFTLFTDNHLYNYFSMVFISMVCTIVQIYLKVNNLNTN